VIGGAVVVFVKVGVGGGLFAEVARWFQKTKQKTFPIHIAKNVFQFRIRHQASPARGFRFPSPAPPSALRRGGGGPRKRADPTRCCAESPPERNKKKERERVGDKMMMMMMVTMMVSIRVFKGVMTIGGGRESDQITSKEDQQEDQQEQQQERSPRGIWPPF
jgi:hypothetical protein